MSKVISSDGTAIAFDRAGDGPPVILVDGALCHRGFGPAKPLAQRLVPHFTVVTYDRRGRGESGDTRPYSVEREVDDIEALVKEAGGSAHLYGISSGAALALEAATRLSNVEKLALYEAPFVVDDTTPPRPDDLVAHLDALIAADRRSEALRLFMRIVGTPAFFILIARLLPVWSKLKKVAHTLPYDLRTVDEFGAGKPLPADRWASATVPALVMDGGKSPAWMRNAMRQLADVLPDARYRTLPGQTHMLKPDAVAPVLVEFFSAS